MLVTYSEQKDDEPSVSITPNLFRMNFAGNSKSRKYPFLQYTEARRPIP